MAIIRSGTFTTVSTIAAQNVVIGNGMSRPTRFTAYNVTQTATPTNSKILKVEWLPAFIDGSAFYLIYSASQPALTQLYTATNGITPFVTSDSLLWVPNQTPYTTNLSTNLVVTAIDKSAQALVSATNSFTSADEGVTWVTFKVSDPTSMIQINTLRGQVVQATSGSQFRVNIDTTGFTTFSGTAQANVITGAPVTTQFGPQVINTPQRNLGVCGVTIGTTILAGGANSDVWSWIAEFDTSVNG
jgi:hypothetical protein